MVQGEKIFPKSWTTLPKEHGIAPRAAHASSDFARFPVRLKKVDMF
ncbi:UNVERIFIED_CONTAM: hypothetical protein ABID98_004789 [Brevibacillus sp. OAP136]